MVTRLKTHLLNAIGKRSIRRSQFRCSDMFLLRPLLMISGTSSFREKWIVLKIYRSLDLLLIDDIQALSKVSTQEEFLNTFNALHGENKQIGFDK